MCKDVTKRIQVHASYALVCNIPAVLSATVDDIQMRTSTLVQLLGSMRPDTRSCILSQHPNFPHL